MHSRTRAKQQGVHASIFQTQASIKSHHGTQASGFSLMRLLLICVSALALTLLCSIMNTTGQTRSTRIDRVNKDAVLPASNVHVDETSTSNDFEQQVPPIIEDTAIDDHASREKKVDDHDFEQWLPPVIENKATDDHDSGEKQVNDQPEAVKSDSQPGKTEEKPEDHQPTEKASVAVEAMEEEDHEPVVEDHPPVELGLGKEVVNEKHHIVSGFDAAMEYLSSYNQSKPIFILLMCDKATDSGLHWSDLCSAAESTIYATLQSTPLDLMILEVRVGSENDWTTARSKFRSDRRFKVKHMPALIRWEGNDRTSDYLGGEQVADTELLTYMLDGKQHINAEPVLRDIPKISKHEDMEKILEKYDGSHPLFFLLISGRLPKINRSWCPYCRLAEIPVEYSYLKYASLSTKLVKINVANTYGAWRAPGNPFKVDTRLHTRGVPALLKVTRTAEGEFTFEKYPESLVYLPGLKELFQSSGEETSREELNERIAPEI